MSIQRIPQTARRFALRAAVGAALVASVAFAPSASAQGQDSQGQGTSSGQRMDPREMIDRRMTTLTDALKLDSAQQVGVRSIVVDETMAMEELRKSSGGQRGAGSGGGGRGGRGGGRRGGGGGGGAPPDSTSSGESRGGSEVRGIRDRTNKQIEKLLNPDQLTTYRQLFEQPQQQR